MVSSLYTRGRLSATITGAAALSLALLSACASAPPPTEQMALSTAAVADAVQAGGAQWAPVDMRAAQDKLGNAQAALAVPDFERARSLAEEAQVDAQLAQAKSHAGKAQKAADEVREAGRVLREEMGRKTAP